MTLNRANSEAGAAAEAEHEDNVRTEVQDTRAVRVDRVERRRPVVAVRTLIVEGRIAPVAGGRQENGIACIAGLLARHQVARYAGTVVIALPRPGAVVSIRQFFAFCLRRHAPIAAPVHVGRIVGQVEHGFVVIEPVFTIA